MATASYQKIELMGNITLYFPFYTPTGQLSITDRINVISDQADREIVLPNATQAQNGSFFLFNNVGAESFKLMLNDGTTELTTILAGEVKEISIDENTTTNGVWSVLPYGSGQNAITTVGVNSSNDSLIITGEPLEPPGGSIGFQISDSLSNLNQIASTGFITITANEPSTYATRNLVAGSNIEIDNSDGMNGDPVINVNNSISNLNSVAVGDITLSGSTITNNNANGDISISTNGTGVISTNGVSIDVSGNITNVNDLTVNGVFNNAYLPEAWGVFTDTINAGVNTIVIEKSQNIDSITGNNGNYVVNFSTPMSSINYGVILSLGSNYNGGALPPPIYHAFWTVRTTNSVTISILDASGEFVQSVPDGVSIIIME